VDKAVIQRIVRFLITRTERGALITQGNDADSAYLFGYEWGWKSINNSMGSVSWDFIEALVDTQSYWDIKIVLLGWQDGEADAINGFESSLAE